MTQTCHRQIRERSQGRTHQKKPCDRPAVEDGLCALHLRVRDRQRAKLDERDPLASVAGCASELTKLQEAFVAVIRRAHEDGESLRAIAVAANMSHEQVRRIVSR
jgi:hypothetical protein